MPLYSLKAKQNCVIENLPEIDLLHFLGLRKGLQVSILSRQPFGGPVVVQCGKRSVAISKEVAEQIEVKEVS